MGTYDVQIANMRTNGVFHGQQTRVITLTPPLKGFGDPDVRNSQYGHSPVRMAVA